MAHTYTVLLYHVVFSTKKRHAWLDNDTKGFLFPYMTGVVSNQGGKTILINGTRDHVHLLWRLKPTHNVAEVVKNVKGSSSHRFHEKTGRVSFAWQEGYGAFSVSQSQRDRVYQYITRQEEHHRTRSFAEEYEALLIKHGVDYDQRFFLD